MSKRRIADDDETLDEGEKARQAAIATRVEKRMRYYWWLAKNDWPPETSPESIATVASAMLHAHGLYELSSTMTTHSYQLDSSLKTVCETIESLEMASVNAMTEIETAVEKVAGACTEISEAVYSVANDVSYAIKEREVPYASGEEAAGGGSS